MKRNIELLHKGLDKGIHGYDFDSSCLQPSLEVIQSALEGIFPLDHIRGGGFRYTPSGEIDSIVRTTAG